MTDEQEAQRGQLAKAVLDNPVYLDSFALIESELTRCWKDSRDPVEREDIHRAFLMLAKTKSVLEGVMRTGQLAEAEIKRKRSAMDKLLRR